jgi:uroporphyrinogen decarboxylase
MTSAERIGAAISGRFADRRAWTATLSLYGAKLRGTPPERYYRDPRLYAEGQFAVAERFGTDLIFGPFALTLEAEAYGAELSWTAKAPPNVSKPIERAAAADLEPAEPGGSAGLAYLVEGVRALATGFAGARPVAGVITAPIDLPALILGIDAWMDILLFDPTFAASLLDLAIEHFARLSRAYFEAGAAFVATPAVFANPRILNAALVEKLTLPALSRAFGAAGGPVYLHHGASPMQGIIHLYRGLPNLAGFVVDERDSFSAIREIIGPEPLLLGGYTGPLMQGRSPAFLGELARRVLEDRKADPRFILASTAADVPWDTPEANIDVIASAIEASAGHPA